MANKKEKKEETSEQAKTTVEAEVVTDEPKKEESTSEKSQSLNIEDIERQILALQNRQSTTSFSDDSTSQISMEQLQKETQELFRNADKIRRSVDVRGEDTGFLKKMTKMLPWGDRLLDKVEDKIHDKSSLKEYVEKFMETIDKTVTNANKYLDQVETRADILDEMIKEGEEILELITKTIVKLQEKKTEERTRQEEKELTRWIVLKTNLAGIQNSNEFSFRQAEDAAKVTYGMTKNMSTLQPIIQQTLQTQTEIIAQNLRNQAMVDGINIGKELINTLQIQNQRESGTLMRETVKIATDPLIEEETLKKLKVGFEENQKKLKLVMQEQSKMIISYNKQVEKNQKVLLEHNQDAELNLPELNYEGKDS